MSTEPITGVLLVDKGQDMTSHDVVAVARRTLNTKKIGHCGTLDPMATGLLILVIGKATKIQDLLMSEDKEYTGSLELGKTTNTQDAEGVVETENEVPDFTEEQIREAFDKFKGDFYQTPPMVSAIKKDGVPLYKLARQGKEVKRDPRFVHVFSYRIDGIELPVVEFTVKCSKGFYVRTYCHDIGQNLGCGAHMKSLRRTRSGKFDLERSVTFEQLKHGNREDIIAKMMSLPEISRLRGA
ncbi:tRNA pseudouridine(55) synthase TruB [Verrucomicrobiales bacterium]|jgi:tRNA pseudouridine55 synthase|nr:tRNA pseudouridine(55) synthase TruB [Verrucomicrobiales bacterium]MDB3940393.1 tRNA pseudouridine(55) synthase TruB [Verrucomicrobiales bacterium]